MRVSRHFDINQGRTCRCSNFTLGSCLARFKIHKEFNCWPYLKYNTDKTVYKVKMKPMLIALENVL